MIKEKLSNWINELYLTVPKMYGVPPYKNVTKNIQIVTKINVEDSSGSLWYVCKNETGGKLNGYFKCKWS